eukprot:jgi/Chrzof1/2359/Cz11g12070.t1
MQRNPPFKTIEADLEQAFYKAGAISEHNAGSFNKIHWMRAARTDKGVSAVCQVVSAKLVIDPQDTLVDRINQHLPAQIRIFGFQRTTEGFDARKFCDKRRYEYVLPAWAFDPEIGRNRDELDLHQGKQQNNKQQQELNGSTQQTDPEGSMQQQLNGSTPEHQPVAQQFDVLPDAAACHHPAHQPSSNQQQDCTDDGPGSNSVDVEEGAEVDEDQDDDGDNGVTAVGVDGGDQAAAAAAAVGSISQDRLRRVRSGANGASQAARRLSLSIVWEEVAGNTFVFTEQHQQQLNAILQQYVGTHNFHNFTVRMDPSRPEATRYMLSFTCPGLIHVNGKPWVKMVVVGQSFMLHQIRKMVGMAVCMMRGLAPPDALHLALDPDRDYNVPMAPELGLFLDEVFYDSYNAKFGHLHGAMSFEPFRGQAEAFKADKVYPHMGQRDDQECVSAVWIRNLSEAHYGFSKWEQVPKVRNLSDRLRKRSHGEGDNKPSVGEVVGSQETYGLSKHRNTPKSQEGRSLKKTRPWQQPQQQQEQQPQQHNTKQHNVQQTGQQPAAPEQPSITTITSTTPSTAAVSGVSQVDDRVAIPAVQPTTAAAAQLVVEPQQAADLPSAAQTIGNAVQEEQLGMLEDLYDTVC